MVCQKTARNGFTLGHIHQYILESVESCAMTSGTSKWAEKLHLAWTAVGPVDIQ